MHTPVGRQNAIRRRDTTDLLNSYINQQVYERQRRSSIVVKKTPDGEDVPVVYKRTRSNPAISDSMVHRLERRRSAVTFQATYRSLNAPLTKKPKPHSSSVSSIADVDTGCYCKKNSRHKTRFHSTPDTSTFSKEDLKLFSSKQQQIRKCLG